MTTMLPTRTFELAAAAEQIQRALQHARTVGGGVLVSRTEPMHDVDPLAAYAHAAGRTRSYWEHHGDRGGMALAAIGEAWHILATGADRFEDADRAWRDLLAGAMIEAPSTGPSWLGPLALGGFRFDPLGARDCAWSAFPDGLLSLPRLMLTRTQGGCWLTLNLIVTPDDEAEHVMRQLDSLRAWMLRLPAAAPAAPARSSGVREQTVHDVLPAGAWEDAVARTAKEIRHGRYDKVVLARQARLPLPDGADPARALARLRHDYPQAFVFAFSRPTPADEVTFLGATPERLLRLEHGLVETAALAGSTRRGATPEDDALLAAALLASTKDRHEHAIVATAIRDALSPLCTRLEMPAQPALLRLRNVQHLHTRVRGLLDGERSALQLVARLHPTPAVGGSPRGDALAAIRAREGMDRGWYAAPVGWLDRHGDGEFAVALRSGLLQTTGDGAEALLFAGCGIMGDSDPAQEYAESALKMRALLSALV